VSKDLKRNNNSQNSPMRIAFAKSTLADFMSFQLAFIKVTAQKNQQ
jgi:hypothetical protein